MRKLRLALTKGEELRFLSHLDFAQAAERMILRAGIATAYSEGFNPHMKISFSSALALGTTAAAEYMDMDVTDERTPEEIVVLLNEQAPPGMRIVGFADVTERSVKKMMAVCNYAVYEVTGDIDAGHDASAIDWAEVLASFNQSEHIPYEKVTPKKTRMVDIKDFVKEDVTAVPTESGVTLRMAIGIYPEGTVKPGEIWSFGRKTFGWPLGDFYTVHRVAVMIEDERGRYSPLEV